ncbi:MAG: CtsR family transcriptional regulator [Aminobacterium colombiense]|jgi:transcriptional regulator CtsR|uniref:Transcriptional repressor, CtsR n=1 Tax=Aminobacterium colombiense (strain DSM 12261 / ALA-1) TaxID=572547 RepID=D5EDR6_AMICL|nr:MULTISPECIES: CtsR family transcriptional regulator [Aminobacterium]MDD2379252.1 CtsR family transcriptional regulator [Aminobacterium colombiense]ADE56698.1 transcriptional repressor, CtsR [Aminobacterium colombiense DSM 12261]MDD4265563.1 CtsR family transcriptional regulator [Aminobacterium colombiense]MDD4585933.1 CtsR family transcriptional regulator [Aminobacterium colombiense]NLK29882.1 CtsR family transcriptional regulator [Aminobacterium colombiense]
MSSLTEVIEDYINKLFQEEMEEEAISLRRKDLAEFFGCVPSQINYVLRSRFTPERGYIVESQRGGHGYIRIVRICYDVPEEKISHIEDIVGNAVSEQDAKRLLAALQDRELLSARERLVIEVAMRFLDEVASSDFDVSPYKRNALQAEILKRMLRGLALA